MSSDTLDELEGLALKSSNHAISEIESLLATWELAKDRPQEYADDVARYRSVHQSLSDWERRMLKSIGKADDRERAVLLRDFSRIFKQHNLYEL